MDNFNEEVGIRIYKARTDKGITLKELGDLIGIAESTAQRYEKGKIKSLDIEMIKKLSKALGVSPAYLMGWESDEDISSSEYAKAVKKLKEILSKTIGEAELKRISSSIDPESYAILKNMSLLKKLTNKDLPLSYFISYLFAAFPSFTDTNMLSNIDNIKELYNDVTNYTEFSLKKIMNKKETPDYLILKAAHEIEGASAEDKQHDYDLMDDDNF